MTVSLTHLPFTTDAGLAARARIGLVVLASDLTIEQDGDAAVVYFTLTFALVGSFKLLERRFLRHLRRETSQVGAAAPARTRPA